MPPVWTISLKELLDIRQLYIYKAFVSLDRSKTTACRDARHNRSRYKRNCFRMPKLLPCELIKNTLTPYRKVEYFLAQSDLLYRRTEVRGENRNLNAKRAFELITESLILAKELNFQDMVEYATKRWANFNGRSNPQSLYVKKGKKCIV